MGWGWRAPVAVVASLLIAIQVVRTAMVEASTGDPAPALRMWPGYARLQVDQAMVEIARASAGGQPAPPETLARIADAARRLPLAAQPFAVRGIELQLAGRGAAAAAAAFEHAKRRDPRFEAPRYFLADYHLRSGDADAGLREIAALGRLVPSGVQSMAPFLAEFARTPANRARIGRLFRREPAVEASVLAILAADARNADLVLALATPAAGKSADELQWRGRLVDALVEAGQVARARVVWARLHGVKSLAAPVFDPGFADDGPPPPFNWLLQSNAVGTAERARGGRLQVVFYGREDGVLARQLLLLAPGPHRIEMQVTGDQARLAALRWTVRCHPGGASLLDLPLAPARQGRVLGRFTVPAGCVAQQLQLEGIGSEFPQVADAAISAFALRLEGGGG